VTECVDGRDETGECPFSSPACNGQVASGTKCFFLVQPKDNAEDTNDNTDGEVGTFTWNEANQTCRKLEGQLASASKAREVSDLNSIWAFGKVDPKSVYIGLRHSWPRKPLMYRSLMGWLDRTYVPSHTSG